VSDRLKAFKEDIDKMDKGGMSLNNMMPGQTPGPLVRLSCRVTSHFHSRRSQEARSASHHHCFSFFLCPDNNEQRQAVSGRWRVRRLVAIKLMQLNKAI
jgi:hypothetical protein